MLSDGRQSSIVADWDDIDASVEIGTAQAECVVVKQTINDGGLEHRYQIKHVSGRRGVLVASTKAGPPDPRTIELSCSVEPLGDPELEGKIMRGVMRRLSDLKGREFAPIRE